MKNTTLKDPLQIIILNFIITCDKDGNSKLFSFIVSWNSENFDRWTMSVGRVVPDIYPPPHIHFLTWFVLISLPTWMDPENGGIPPWSSYSTQQIVWDTNLALIEFDLGGAESWKAYGSSGSSGSDPGPFSLWWHMLNLDLSRSANVMRLSMTLRSSGEVLGVLGMLCGVGGVVGVVGVVTWR